MSLRNLRNMKELAAPVSLASWMLGLIACSSAEHSGAAAGGSSGSDGATGGMCSGGSAFPGSCSPHQCQPNPDYAGQGPCAPDCQSVSCSASQNRPCTQDCCATCGIDQWGSKLCTCPVPGAPFANCSCSPPPFIPAGLHGGPCMPTGDSRPASMAADSLRFVPCSTADLVCFTADSTGSSERGCICRDDGVGNGGMGPGLFLHCGSVNHWFTNDGVPVVYTP